VPEGDTIRRLAGILDDALRGKALTRIEVRRDPRGRRPPERGTTVESVEARGKHLLVHLGDGSVLHTHMHMDGSWHVYRTGERWRAPGREARVILEADDGTQAVCFSAPLVELRTAGDTRPTRATRALAELGPDLCDPEPDFDEALRRLAEVASTAPEAPVGEVLLDQRVAAGVGNVYRSEVLWACRTNPFTPLGSADDASRRALYTTAHEQLRANLDEWRRVTWQDGLAVYDRSGRPCPRCRTAIRRSEIGRSRRSVWWCPTCQPEPPERP
jgi:endonuclease-8